MWTHGAGKAALDFARPPPNSLRVNRAQGPCPCVSKAPTDYVATEDLTIAVNAAVTLERPLLVKGEPGTGKTELARQVAARSACR
jgi:MoxR-like ATPase